MRQNHQNSQLYHPRNKKYFNMKLLFTKVVIFFKLTDPPLLPPPTVLTVFSKCTVGKANDIEAQKNTINIHLFIFAIIYNQTELKYNLILSHKFLD